MALHPRAVARVPADVLTVLLRAEESEAFRAPRAVAVALAWSVPVLSFSRAGRDPRVVRSGATRRVEAGLLVALTWLVVVLAVIAVKLRAA
jgi:hypothetical protein